jgi:hypothetical protein
MPMAPITPFDGPPSRITDAGPGNRLNALCLAAGR